MRQLLNVLYAQPFRHFNVHMCDGRFLRVDHPEWVSRTTSGRAIVIYFPDSSYHIVDLYLVTDLEVDPLQSVDASSNGPS